MSFEPLSTPIIDMRRKRDRSQHFVLWPVYVWRALAPVSRSRQLNLFQRAVLGLCVAGVTLEERISERLMLAPEHVALILEQLKVNGHIDQSNVATRKGNDCIEDIQDDLLDDPKSGLCLVSASSGDLLPYFVLNDLLLANTEPKADAQFPTMLSGPVGDPWRVPPFVPKFKGLKPPSPPSPRDILGAVRFHNRALKIAAEPYADAPSPQKLSRVSVVDHAPAARYLALKVERHEDDWVIADPFVPKSRSSFLRHELMSYIKDDGASSPLKLFLYQCLMSRDERPSDLRFEELIKQARQRVDYELGAGILEHEALHARLVELERARLESELPHAPRDKHEDVLVKAQRAAERSLRMLTQLAPWRRQGLYSDLLSRDNRSNARLLCRVARELGFEEPAERLFTLQRGKIEHAERSSEGGLKPALAVVLLQAHAISDHRLRAAAPAHPALIRDLLLLAEARDGAAHDRDDQDETPVDTLPHVSAVYDLVRSLSL